MSKKGCDGVLTMKTLVLALATEFHGSRKEFSLEVKYGGYDKAWSG